MKTKFALFLIILLASFGMAQAQPVTYLWSNGATTPEIVVNTAQTATYYVTITQDGEQYFDSLVVLADSSVQLFAQDTVRGCGPLLALFAPEGQWDSLAWSNGQSGSNIQVSSSGWYFLDATDTSGCTIRDSVIIKVNPKPEVSIEGDLFLVAGETGTLSASGASTYVWNTGQSGSSISISPTANQEYSAIGTTEAGCSDTAMVLVQVVTGTKGTHSSRILLYPNPLPEKQQFLSLEMPGEEGRHLLEISDLAGKVLLEEKELQSGLQQIRLPEMAKGLYNIRIWNTAGGEPRYFRLMRQ